MAFPATIELTLLLSPGADRVRVEHELTALIDAPALRTVADKPGMRLFCLTANRASYSAYFGPTANRELPSYLREHIFALEEAPTRRLS